MLVRRTHMNVFSIWLVKHPFHRPGNTNGKHIFNSIKLNTSDPRVQATHSQYNAIHYPMSNRTVTRLYYVTILCHNIKLLLEELNVSLTFMALVLRLTVSHSCSRHILCLFDCSKNFQVSMYIEECSYPASSS